jgi:hypothetical protein
VLQGADSSHFDGGVHPFPVLVGASDVVQSLRFGPARRIGGVSRASDSGFAPRHACLRLRCLPRGSLIFPLWSTVCCMMLTSVPIPALSAGAFITAASLGPTISQAADYALHFWLQVHVLLSFASFIVAF